jgi:hypothetical protein
VLRHAQTGNCVASWIAGFRFLTLVIMERLMAILAFITRQRDCAVYNHALMQLDIEGLK